MRASGVVFEKNLDLDLDLDLNKKKHPLSPSLSTQKIKKTVLKGIEDAKAKGSR